MNKKCKGHQKHLRNNADCTRVSADPELMNRIQGMINQSPSGTTGTCTASIESSTDSFSTNSYRRRRRYSKQKAYRRTLGMYDATISDVSEQGGDDLSCQEKLIQLMHEELNSGSIDAMMASHRSLLSNNEYNDISSVDGFDEFQKQGEAPAKVSEKVASELEKPPIENIIVSHTQPDIDDENVLSFSENYAITSGDFENANNPLADNISKISNCSPTTHDSRCQEYYSIYQDAVRIRSQSQDASHESEYNRNTRVRFNTVSIRHYERILTENPSTIEGPSIGIGWNYVEEKDISLYHYEQYVQNNRKLSVSLVLNREQRQDILFDLGYTPRQIASAVRGNNRARNQRRQTVQNLKVARFEEAIENVKGRCMNLISVKGKKSSF